MRSISCSICEASDSMTNVLVNDYVIVCSVTDAQVVQTAEYDSEEPQSADSVATTSATSVQQRSVVVTPDVLVDGPPRTAGLASSRIRPCLTTRPRSAATTASTLDILQIEQRESNTKGKQNTN